MKIEGKAYRHDVELVEAVRSGDNIAFKEIVLEYERMIARVTNGMLGNKADAEEVGQETFIRFYRSIDQYKGDSSLGTYLTRIAINLSLNEIKRRKKRNLISIEDQASILKSTDDHTKKLETAELVNMALSKLEPDFKSVVVLRLIQGYSTRETAKILDLPLGTVLSRLARAQKKLRVILGGLDN